MKPYTRDVHASGLGPSPSFREIESVTVTPNPRSKNLKIGGPEPITIFKRRICSAEGSPHVSQLGSGFLTMRIFTACIGCSMLRDATLALHDVCHPTTLAIAHMMVFLVLLLLILLRLSLWLATVVVHTAATTTGTITAITKSHDLYLCSNHIILTTSLCRILPGSWLWLHLYHGDWASRMLQPNLHPISLLRLSIHTKIAWLKHAGKILMDMRIPPLIIKIMLESSPLKSIILVRRLAVWKLVSWCRNSVCGNGRWEHAEARALAVSV